MAIFRFFFFFLGGRGFLFSAYVYCVYFARYMRLVDGVDLVNGDSALTE